MKINDIDWSKVPDILAKEQVRLLCHCSKRTALYYLKSGKLPCIYSGKKTRCYKIRKEDLMAFIEDRENHPEFYAVFRKDQAHLSAAFFALTFAGRSGTYPRIS